MSISTEENKLKNEIITLKTKRNRLLRQIKSLEKQHITQLKKTHKTLYILPSFLFENECNPDKCILCGKESDLIIGKSDGTPWYGLCRNFFNALLQIEEKHGKEVNIFGE